MDWLHRISELKFVPRIGHIIPLEFLAEQKEAAKRGRENETKDNTS